jgi:hypothetical protein
MSPGTKKNSKKRVDPADGKVEVRPNPGVISFAEGDEICIDFSMECANCGTMIEFLTDRCPICGKKFDVSNTGLVSLFSDMDFDTDRASEIDCPVCGEKIRPVRGKCPECSEPISFTGSHDPGIKVDPIVHDDNVVFVHLDVESGEVNCLQRAENGSGLEHLSVHVETVGQGEFERSRRGVSRM